MTNPAIVIEHVSKTFRRYHADRPRTIQETLAKGFRRVRASEQFWGLRDVSVTVARGRTVGIIGSNGSGKSTLLRLVGGIGKVDEGRIIVNGRIGALLDLGLGFHSDLTGRENVLVSGVLAGLTRREVLERFESIVDFAEIGAFIDNPVRTYSTGMQMRLAFATAVHTDAEILLIDEVLSVGDTAFQNKCLDRIAQFKASGCSILLVSHESGVVQELCDEAVWLSHGQLMAHDDANSVVRAYMAFLGGTSIAPEAEVEEIAEVEEVREDAPDGELPAAPENAETVAVSDEPDADTPEALVPDEGAALVADAVVPEDVPAVRATPDLEITAVALIDRAGQIVEEMQSGKALRLQINYRTFDAIKAPIFRVRIVREDGLVCYEMNTQRSRTVLPTVVGTARVRLLLERTDLNTGRYRVEVSAFTKEWMYAFDHYVDDRWVVIHGESDAAAVLDAPHRWEFIQT